MKTAKSRSQNTQNQGEAKKRHGWRSRGWQPLQYPTSAVIGRNRKELCFFPLHTDVLLAAIRELLIYDGCIHARTLEVNDEKARRILGLSLVAHGQNDAKKRKKDDVMGSFTLTSAKFVTQEDSCKHTLSAEIIADEMLLRLQGNITDSRLQSCPGGTTENPRPCRRPRIVSEADQATSSVLPNPSDLTSSGLERPQWADYQSIVELNAVGRLEALLKKDELRDDSNFEGDNEEVEALIYVSISNEAILRDAAMAMTNQLATFFF
mmetsp:Transcript_1330/g.2413  ORF Transcript_1330/g.2413 Transcript_1330/m.2413 type:complete len:265 (+) Transcript_1330:39-833(+)